MYFKDGVVRASYTAAEGWVRALSRVSDSIAMMPLWAATQEGGLSRFKDGRVATLTTNNGLPCDTIHWSIEDDDGAFWLYTACGLVRIARTELEAWIVDPKRRVETTRWDAADGVRLTATSLYFGPPSRRPPTVNCGSYGRGCSIVDPHHLAFNKVPPPVHIEQIIADHKSTGKTYPMEFPACVCQRWMRDLRSTIGAEPRSAREGSLQVQARRAGQRLARGDQRSRSAVLKPASWAIPVSCNRR